MSAFDKFDRSYTEVVQSSIDFSGLPHSFFMTAKAEVLRAAVQARLGAGDELQALDVGCGVGAFHPGIRGIFARLCGVDVSANCIEQARRSNAGVAYKTYTDEFLPYDDATFDVTMAVCVMHHVAPRQWPVFLAEMRRVTRRGGLVCVIEHNPFNPLTRFAVSRCEFDRDAVLLRSGQIERLMSEVGLNEIESQYFLLLPSALPLVRRIERTFKRLPLGAQYMTLGTA
jgi:ubiquinone/menaquinone biosynthesis C-methylase UbiE